MENNFKPYISAKDFIPEFTLKAIILGSIFGIIFGAATVYLGLKVGLTVSASIPIAVLAISVFKKIGKATILESNIVQTIGSAGESVAAGVLFTVPALLFLAEGKNYFQYFQIFVLSLTGGILGVLFMVPLRRALIVKEHGKLGYPEGTACANVLIAGEKGGNLAQKVYFGLGFAFLYKFLMSILGLWKDVPTYIFSRKSSFPNGSISAEITPELLGVGYVIGPKIAGVMVAGGIMSFWVLIPVFTFIGDSLTVALAPGTTPISQLDVGGIRNYYIKYIGAGAVTFGGIITLLKTLPTIVSAFSESIKSLRDKSDKDSTSNERTNQDLPITFVLGGCVFLVGFMMLMPNLPVNFLSALLIIVFGFFFVTVASRIVGLVGSSSSPVSGMTIATLIGTCLVFLAMGMTKESDQPIALVVGAIVCIAAANAGATSQDLKTGYLVGATPIKQQFGLMIGVLVSTVAIGFTLLLLNDTLGIGAPTKEHPNALSAPQADLMATVIKGMLSNSLPWSLLIIGMAIAAVIELCGVNSLAFAVGAYLPLSATTPIYAGGLIRWAVDKRNKEGEDSDTGPGALFSSGLIAGGAITGIVIAILIGTNITGSDGKPTSLMSMINTGLAEKSGDIGTWIAVASFAIMCGLLYWVAVGKVEAPPQPSPKERD
jgi:putative OPT family oligopeptide transporter